MTFLQGCSIYSAVSICCPLGRNYASESLTRILLFFPRGNLTMTFFTLRKQSSNTTTSSAYFRASDKEDSTQAVIPRTLATADEYKDYLSKATQIGLDLSICTVFTVITPSRLRSASSGPDTRPNGTNFRTNGLTGPSGSQRKCHCTAIVKYSSIIKQSERTPRNYPLRATFYWDHRRLG